MKTEKHVPEEERLNKIEADLQLIKSMLKEVLAYHANGNTASQERIMNVNEAIDFIGVEKHVLYSKCANGEIPCFRAEYFFDFWRLPSCIGAIISF